MHNSFEDFASKYPTYPRDVVSLYNLYLHLGIYHSWTALRLEAIAALGCYVLLGREPARVRTLIVHGSFVEEASSVCDSFLNLIAVCGPRR